MSPDQNLLVQVRDRHSLSQEQLASLLKVSFTTINAWENGKRKVPKERQAALQELLRSAEIPTEGSRASQYGLPRSEAGFVSSVISYAGRRDVNPLTHGIGRWYGNLPSFLVSDLVEFCISDLKGVRRALVNFCGSGTAALEFALAGVECTAIDVNPAAWLFSTVKTQRLTPPTERAIHLLVGDARTVRTVGNKRKVSAKNLVANENKWVTPASRKLFAQTADAINRKRNSDDRIVFAAALLNVAVDFCQIDKRCTNHYVFKSNAVSSEEFFEAFERQCLLISNKLKLLANVDGYKKPRIELQDNRRTTFKDGAFDVVFSHPPYGTMINYFSMSRIHLSILELIDIDLGVVADDGLLCMTQRVDQSSSTNKAFSQSIKPWVYEAHRALSPGGHLVCIVGDGRDRGFLNHPHTEIIQQAEAAGMRLRELFIWVTENKSGMHVKRKGHHIDHNYILVLQKTRT